MKRLIIVGSPRVNGRSAHLAEMLFEANIDERPQDELFLVPLSEVEVGPCIACNACREKTPVIYKDDDGRETSVLRNRCVFDDDMQALYDLIDDADELTVVSPVFFSGAPAQLKCLLDRLQPYFWANARAGEKRPAALHVVGEGGDPHGYDALVSEVRSALAVAGFRLKRVLDWVDKISEQGEITDEAREITFDDGGKKQRPKLDLSAGKPQQAGKAQPAAKSQQAGNAQLTGKPQQAGNVQPAGKPQQAGRAQESKPAQKQSSKKSAGKKQSGQRQPGKKGGKRG